MSHMLINLSRIDLKFIFYSKIFLSLWQVHGEVHVGVHACTSDYLRCINVRCTIVYANLLLGAQKNVHQISNSWSPATTLHDSLKGAAQGFGVKNREKLLWIMPTEIRYLHISFIATLILKYKVLAI